MGLPGGAVFAGQALQRGETLLCAQCDVRDFLYSLGVPREVAEFFGLPAVPGGFHIDQLGIAEVDGERWTGRA